VASRRKEHQEDSKLRVLNLIYENPQSTSRELAQKVGISHGSAHYLLVSLIDKGYLKISNFKKCRQKRSYLYFLTPKGIREKSLISTEFIIRKKREFELLKEEIECLEKSIDGLKRSSIKDC